MSNKIAAQENLIIRYHRLLPLYQWLDPTVPTQLGQPPNRATLGPVSRKKHLAPTSATVFTCLFHERLGDGNDSHNPSWFEHPAHKKQPQDPAIYQISGISERNYKRQHQKRSLNNGLIPPVIILDMSNSLIPTLFLALILPAVCDTRPWKSTDGTRSIQGEFIKRDATTVTIRTNGGKEFTIELSKLHPDESKWLDSYHSLAPATDPASFFENLTFRDTRETTIVKLKASKTVEMTADETFIGRSGLNGIFRTRQKVGALNGFLYFDWTEAGKLKELNIQTESRPATSYKNELEPAWKQFIDLLSALYGNPESKGSMPAMASVTDGLFVPSHFWKLPTGGSALLGTAREGEKYQVVVRFTEKSPGVIEIP